MGCGDVRLLRTIRSVDFTGQERAALNKLTMSVAVFLVAVVLRLAFGLGYWNDKPLTRDEQEYLALAASLAGGHGFTYDRADQFPVGDRFFASPGLPRVHRRGHVARRRFSGRPRTDQRPDCARGGPGRNGSGRSTTHRRIDATRGRAPGRRGGGVAGGVPPGARVDFGLRAQRGAVLDSGRARLVESPRLRLMPPPRTGDGCTASVAEQPTRSPTSLAPSRSCASPRSLGSCAA